MGNKKYQQFKTQVEKSTVNPEFRFHSPDTWGTITGRSCLIDFEARDKQLMSSDLISEAVYIYYYYYYFIKRIVFQIQYGRIFNCTRCHN